MYVYTCMIIIYTYMNSYVYIHVYFPHVVYIYVCTHV